MILNNKQEILIDIKKGKNMKIKFVYKIIPVAVFYTDFLVDKNLDGKNLGLFIVIRPRCKDDIQLLNHELIHTKQLFRMGLTSWIFMALSEKWRIKLELEAYLNTLGCNRHMQRFITNTLSKNYKIKKYTKDDIKKIIKEECEKMKLCGK